jgi:hypothetical protein
MFTVELYCGVTNSPFLEKKDFMCFIDGENWLRSQPRHIYGYMYEVQKVVFITRNRGWTQPEGASFKHIEPTYSYRQRSTALPLNHAILANGDEDDNQFNSMQS